MLFSEVFSLCLNAAYDRLPFCCDVTSRLKHLFTNSTPPFENPAYGSADMHVVLKAIRIGVQLNALQRVTDWLVVGDVN